MKHERFALAAICLALAPAVAGERPANSDVALEESFSRDELGERWNSTTGQWKIVNGVLRGREITAEKHSAATRCSVESQNAVYELKFRFVDEGKAFHFGFDPAQGELNKKGHLFSIIVTPNSWSVLKHVDKSRPDEDPNQTLAEQKTEFRRGEWYALQVTTWENYVTARIEGKQPLKAAHSTFAVRKPTLVFRCLGDGVEIDDIRVWSEQKK